MADICRISLRGLDESDWPCQKPAGHKGVHQTVMTDCESIAGDFALGLVDATITWKQVSR